MLRFSCIISGDDYQVVDEDGLNDMINDNIESYLDDLLHDLPDGVDNETPNAPWNQEFTEKDFLLIITLTKPITLQLDKEGEVVNSPTTEIYNTFNHLLKDTNYDISLIYDEL